MANPDFRGFHRGIGDDSNKPVLEILVGGEGTATYPRSLHIAQSSAETTDWNVSASADPIVYVHSTTTPATDYVSVTHDGTTGTITSAGGILNLTGTGSVVVNEGSGDVDFRVESDAQATCFLVDAGASMVKVGATTAHGTTAGTLGISLFEGTAPAGTLANGATLFADVVSSDEVLRGIDSAGNVTTI